MKIDFDKIYDDVVNEAPVKPGVNGEPEDLLSFIVYKLAAEIAVSAIEKYHAAVTASEDQS